MPVPVPPAGPAVTFPTLTRENIDAARTSQWLDKFEDITANATVIDIDALGERDAFLKLTTQWIEEDGIFLPEDSEGSVAGPSRPRSASVSSTSSTSAPVYHLPKMNAAIRDAIKKYGAVFPKLNWTAPRDAAFLLPQGHGPLHCTTPADVYLLLKSSDFTTHGLDQRAYEGAESADASAPVDNFFTVPHLELVLKAFTEMNPSREVRCFVRDNTLIAIEQRDANFYEHLQTPEAQAKIVTTVREFWEDEIRENYDGGDHYVFDLYLGEHGTPTIVDFGAYRESTDAVLFSYEEMQQLLEQSREPQVNSAGEPESATATPPPTRLPVLRVIDSAAHPAANRAAPQFGTNMMPLEMLEMSEGRTLQEFTQAWEEAMRLGGGGDDSDSDDEE